MVSAVGKVSIIVPVWNERGLIQDFLARITGILDSVDCAYEIVFVNDGSNDGTDNIIAEAARDDERVKLVSLSRNFGKEAALTAGLDHCDGDCAIPMDVDMQDPPELIPEMIQQWIRGFEVVNAIRSDRSADTLGKRLTADLFYRLFNYTADSRIPSHAGDFRLLDRKVIEAIRSLPERNRFMKGIFAWVGFKQTQVYFQRCPRQQGNSKWNYWKLWNYAIDALTAFGSWPLKIWTYVGTIIAMLSALYGLFLITRVLISGVDVPGYASLMVVVLFFGGIQLLTLGILGEYIGRIYTESKHRPIYLVSEMMNIKQPNDR
ncbi:glycosyltransferase family 2 protein [Pseudomaricurvus alkylphenolicus]|nr:glycosyltransferase family 2 protein [Pseudomaricurvus alkylphenolicus]